MQHFLSLNWTLCNWISELEPLFSASVSCPDQGNMHSFFSVMNRNLIHDPPRVFFFSFSAKSFMGFKTLLLPNMTHKVHSGNELSWLFYCHGDRLKLSSLCSSLVFYLTGICWLLTDWADLPIFLCGLISFSFMWADSFFFWVDWLFYLYLCGCISITFKAFHFYFASLFFWFELIHFMFELLISHFFWLGDEFFFFYVHFFCLVWAFFFFFFGLDWFIFGLIFPFIFIWADVSIFSVLTSLLFFLSWLFCVCDVFFCSRMTFFLFFSLGWLAPLFYMSDYFILFLLVDLISFFMSWFLFFFFISGDLFLFLYIYFLFFWIYCFA